MVHFQYESRGSRRPGPSFPWLVAGTGLSQNSELESYRYSAVRQSPWSEKGAASSPKSSLDKGMHSKPMRWGIREETNSGLWEKKTGVSPNLGLEKLVPYQTSAPVIAALSLRWHPILQNCILKTLFPLASWVHYYELPEVLGVSPWAVLFTLVLFPCLLPYTTTSLPVGLVLGFVDWRLFWAEMN